MSEALYQVPDQKALDTAIAELAVAFQRVIDAGTIKVYRRALSDLPLWAIQQAAEKLSRKGGTFFPSAPEWHQAAEEAIQDQQRDQLTRKRDADTLHECMECRDTGWADLQREDGTPYVVPCSCRAWNETYKRNTLASRKSLNEEVKRSKSK